MINIQNKDFMDGLSQVKDHSVDLIIMDPPYKMGKSGGGCFGNKNREYLNQIIPLTDGITLEQLDAIMSKMKAINCYIWCNKAQIRGYLDYFDDRGCLMDLLTWHKKNPTPACKNKYLSDTEYLLYFKDPGVPLYGTYETKRKYYVTPYNKADKEKYNHPIKPLGIIRNLIINSSRPGDLVMDPFLGSGTTAVACAELGRDCVGFEINADYYNTARGRLDSVKKVNNMDRWLDC